MSDETAFQSDDTVVTKVLLGVAVERAFTSNAAVTSVIAVFAVVLQKLVTEDNERGGSLLVQLRPPLQTGWR